MVFGAHSICLSILVVSLGMASLVAAKGQEVLAETNDSATFAEISLKSIEQTIEPLPQKADPTASYIQLAQTDLPEPTGRVILTISGAISRTNGEGVARFDKDMLQTLGSAVIRTTTSWTDGVKEFRGVPAAAVMDAVGATGTTILATALNDYVVEIPISDYEEYGVLFAFMMDGKELTRRDRGPIWPVYPRDDFPELRNRASDKKWIWQVVTMEIR